MLVVADTGPPHYLLLIDAIDLLPRLFGAVTLPMPVLAELCHPAAPPAVRAWAAVPPPWVAVVAASDLPEAARLRLGPGEAAAIALAQAQGATLLLMDDRAGVAAARARGLAVVGTLGLLDFAARRGLLDLAAALARLQATNFRVRPEVVEALLAQHRTGQAG